MKTLCVFGMVVYAPTCPKCGSDENVIVQDRGDCWTYHCTECKRDLDYDEIE